jgi:hypothetical protein
VDLVEDWEPESQEQHQLFDDDEDYSRVPSSSVMTPYAFATPSHRNSSVDYTSYRSEPIALASFLFNKG